MHWFEENVQTIEHMGNRQILPTSCLKLLKKKGRCKNILLMEIIGTDETCG
jgi:hypothetical protein